MTTPSKAQARMVPADQPEASRGKIVLDGAEPVTHQYVAGLGFAADLVHAEARSQTELALRGHAGAQTAADRMAVVEKALRSVMETIDAARPAAPTAPATPAVGVGTSGVGSGAPAGAGEVGLGDAIRAHATTARTRPRADDLWALADRADVLEARIERTRARVVRMTERRDEKTRRHGIALLHILDGDS